MKRRQPTGGGNSTTRDCKPDSRYLETMDRAAIEQRLALAEQHVSEGKRILENQGRLLAKVAADGYDTTEAERLLAQFEDVQRLYLADRDRLRNELARHRPEKHRQQETVWPPKDAVDRS